MNDDELLLRQLADAFAPERSVPPAEGLQALHRSIDASTRIARPQRRRLRRRWLLPALATVSALGIGNLALAAAGTSLPRVVRAVAHDVHLPVDSPALLDTRRHRDALREALGRRDLGAIEAEAREVRAALDRLDHAERNAVAVEVEQLLARADSDIDEDDAPSTTRPTSTTPEVTSGHEVQTDTNDADENTEDEGPDPSTEHATTDTSSTGGNTDSDGDRDSGNNHSGDGQNVDNGQSDSGQQNDLSDQSGGESGTSSEGDSAD